MAQPVCVQRVCPICGDDKHREILHAHKFAAFHGVSFLQGYDVVCCEICGGVFADNIPGQEDFERYYKEYSKYERPADESLIHNRNAELLIRGLQEKNARVLDIGCGMGRFLHSLQKLGFKNLEGIDPSPMCTRYVNESLGIPCLEGSFPSLKHLQQKTQFDAVVLSYVLEHIVNTREILDITCSLIKTDGLLYIGVPNSTTFNPSINAPFQEFSTEHINYFCLESLKNLLGSYGFELVLFDSCRQAGMDCVFRKGNTSRQIIKEFESKKNIECYLEKSKLLDGIILNKLSAYARGGIIVWGTGALTLRLLANGLLNIDNIKVFVDSNPHYIGGSFKGVPVIAPDMLVSYSEPIVISSFDWYNEILSKIRNELSLSNEVISLK